MIEECSSSPCWAGGGDCYGSSPYLQYFILLLLFMLGLYVGLVMSYFLGPFGIDIRVSKRIFFW